jgi:RNA polymerase sigma factor FliA
MYLKNLTRADTRDSQFAVTTRNIEVATAYALRAADKWKDRIPGFMDPESFDEAVILVVMRAASNYDPKNGASFFTYAHSMVRGALQEEYRVQNRRAGLKTHADAQYTRYAFIPTSLDAFISFQKNSNDENVRYTEALIDLAPQNDPQWHAELQSQVDQIKQIAADVLTEREHLVFELRFLQEMRQKDVADVVGLTASRINQIEKDILAKLKSAVPPDQDCE